MATRIVLNKAQRQRIENQVYQSKDWQKAVRKMANEKMKKLQANLLKAFSEHPVTKELKMGPMGTNISGTLSGIEGNLFGFIGFERDDDPIRDLIRILSEKKIQFINTGNKTIIKIIVPSKEEIFAQTPLPWATGRSWAKSIETGLSGLGMYIYDFGYASRSKAGIQTKNKVRNAKFKNVSYLSEILRKYYKSIKKLESQF